MGIKERQERDFGRQFATQFGAAREMFVRRYGTCRCGDATNRGSPAASTAFFPAGRHFFPWPRKLSELAQFG